MTRKAIHVITLIVLIAFGSLAIATEPDREEAIKTLEQEYGEVSLNTMLWTLNPRRPDHLKLFLAAGFPADARLTFGEGDDSYELSLLQYTLQFSCDNDETADVVHLLVDAGADPSEPSPNTDYSPLMKVVECERIVGILLRAGADPNYRNEREETPLSIAVARGVDESVRLLIDGGADVHGDHERLLKWAKNSSGASPTKLMLIEKALSKPAPEELKPWEVRQAIGERNVDVVRAYIEANPSAATTIDDEPSLLILTTRCSKTEAVEPVLEIMDLLIGKGADVNAVGGALEETALHPAAKQCDARVVKRLIDAGADIEVRNRADQAPLFLAVFGDNPGAFEVLLDAGAKVDKTTKFFAKNKPEMKKLLKKKR